MSLKWIFALLVVVYGYNCFAGTIKFSKLIEENYRDQLKLASEIQDQLGITHRKLQNNRSTTEASIEDKYLY